MKAFRSMLPAVVIALLLPMAMAQDVVRLDPALDKIVSANAKVEKVRDNLKFAEGPVWVQSGGEGYLLFSDIPANVIYKWSPDGKLTVAVDQILTVTDVEFPSNNNGREDVTMIGADGVAIDPQGRIAWCLYAGRKVVRQEKNGKRTVLTDSHAGKLFRNPNDLIFKSNGTLYFTDSGGTRKSDDPQKVLPTGGLYLMKNGKTMLAAEDAPRPNGLVLSPDEKFLYVNEMSTNRVLRFDVLPDDTLANRHVFFDMSTETAEGTLDGMKVDAQGNVYATGRGGLWILTPQGKPLGRILAPERIANLAFGGADGKTLFLTARTGLYRIQLNASGFLNKGSR